MGSVRSVDRTAAPGVPLDGLLERIAARAPRGRGPVLRTFAEAYVRRLPSAELALRADDLPGEVRGAFALADGRGNAEVAVRAFNPTTADDGYETPGSVLETNTPDSPFLFDSVNEELQARGLAVTRVVHPVIGTERDAKGRLTALPHVREAATRESVMHFEVDRRLGAEELADLETRIRSILGDVRLTVRDFEPMRERIVRMIEIARDGARRYPADAVDETVAFLRWLLDLNFVFLGYGEYDLVEATGGRALVVAPGSGLGILSKEDWSSHHRPTPLAAIPEALRARVEDGELLIYSKTNAMSTVHRRARMDYIGVRRLGPDGTVIGEARMIGLFTSKAYMEPASATPVLAGKLRRILEAEDLFEGSHDYKAAVAIFESFPKDELFAAPVDDLREQVMGLLSSQEQRHIRLFVRPDIPGRSVSILVALPRDRFTTDLRRDLDALFLRRFGGARVDYNLALGGSAAAQIHFTVHVAEGPIPEVAYQDLERDVVALAETWDDRLLAGLEAARGFEAGREAHAAWADRFPETYRARTPIDLAILDVAHLERRSADDPFAVAVCASGDPDEPATRVRIYRAGARVLLSEVVPLLEDLGLTVVDEWPTHVGGLADLYLHDFGVVDAAGRPIDVEAAGGRVARCLEAVWRGDCESDSLHRLIVRAGLEWQQVELLRAYRKYHHRVNAGFPVELKNDVFAAHPDVAAGLVRLFSLRFDPAVRDEAAAAAVHAEILAALDGVTSLEHDRVLRNALGLVDATVRTNAFRPDRTALSLKFRSSAVPEMPKPVPLYEIFVYATETEAIHLRRGAVARGGIRWSDRLQDYRTEVLDLMKAQTVKNAVIVPNGAKGGFVVKRPPADPAALRDAVRRSYVTFMRGMLDVTDNLVGGAVVHPEGVVVLDEDDPYLVVAADKGTATFSDTANEVAADYRFWLGDAFASGGSAGYDHKALGITARGAWESVKRHFRELGADVDREPITVVGIGDMSGDVFGNGMLRSDQLCLVAAFDHRHVFVDPTPVPAVGFAERTRLFALPGSSWDDYDRSMISRGGGVWPRSEKSIPLSPEMRAALGVEGDALSPDDVIRAILRAPVDLLWNGGIGTWVKATDESHAAVGDRTNDALRVDAAELRCRVVAEGGNLGFTQRARIEFARRGGRINADWIDNSAGVDCSDHEVNLKILLEVAVARGDLDRADRDRLLHEVEDAVVAHVLYDNFSQAQILSQEAQASPGRMEAIEDLMQALEAEGLLDRRLEALPSTEEMAERRRDGRGMTRPELAVLLAWAKKSLAGHVLASTLPESAYLAQDLRVYFPSAVVDRFDHLIFQHQMFDIGRRDNDALLSAESTKLTNGKKPFDLFVDATNSLHPAQLVQQVQEAIRATRETLPT